MTREFEFPPNPPKLLELEHPYGEILARGNREYETRPGEAEHFYRTRAGKGPRRGRRALVIAPIAIAAAAVIALAVGMVARSGQVSKGVTSHDTRVHAPATLPLDPTPAVPAVADEPSVKLDAGESKLRDGSVVRLAPGGFARLRDRGNATSIVLERGKVTLTVESRPAKAALELAAGAYRFKVIGTRFSVTRAGDAIALRVDEGRVAVFDDEVELAIVSAGGDWSSAEPTPTVPAPDTSRSKTRPEPSPPPPDPEPNRASDCRAFARGGEPRKAEACYLARSSGSGLEAETALLEVARLRRDVLGDSAGALQALEGYRNRFPHGSLRGEADIAHVALLTRLGRQSEALAESQRLLDSPNGRERAFELRMLRGNIHRKSGNVLRAAQEFAQAEALDGASSEATYFHGVSIEELGDAAGAAAAYRRYLEKSPTGKRASDVRKRLGRRSP
jgi:hypothetical protein